MALVERSERKIKYSQFEPNVPGPGQYLGQDIIKQKPPSNVPFNSNTYRDINVKKNENPGPGSYENDESLNNSASNKDGSIKRVANHKQLGFLSAEKRFPIDINSFETPGPGQYQQQTYPKRENLGNSHENHRANRILSSVNRVPSIPSKAQSYGYEYNNEGVAYLVEDPDKFDKFGGTKHDSVGPGRYDLDNPEIWKKNFVDWKRMSNEEPKLNYGNDNQDKNRYVNRNILVSSAKYSNLNTKANSQVTISEPTNNEIKLEKKKKNVNSRYQQALKKRSEVMDFHKQNDEDNLIEKIINTESPGPGYYFKENYQYANMRYLNQFQTFGSSSQRFSGDKNRGSSSPGPGPGQYFKNDIGFHKRNSINKIFSLNIYPRASAEKKSNLVKESNISIVGPGYYDLTENFVKKPLSQISHFGVLEKRFPAQNQSLENSPGPGSYIAQETWAKPRYKEQVPRIIREDKDTSVIKDENSSIPPIGTYNPDFVSSIKYQVAMHSNRYQGIIAPFASMEKRFKKKKCNTNDNVGPGCYYTPKIQPPTQKSLPFLVGSTRLSNSKSEHDVGPGKYNRDSYFDWNKKSFNVLFI